ncbi:MAG: M14 family zinc carboxypeptidase [Bacteroidia bacterium]|nr:M14 family zinc carboxypeptidase [Bacteroidia bacterium]MDW8346541.1 M14 family zinc carboxypeptidase [Bacteroidia bacterium]
MHYGYTYVLICLLCSTFWSAAQEKYAKVRIYATIEKLAKLGLDVEHGEYREGHSFTSDFSYTEIDKLTQNNIQYDILISDVIEYYVKRNQISYTQKVDNAICIPATYNPADTIKTPTGFTLGSMGGFFTYNEFITHLNTLRANYPSLVSKIDTIGYSIQNRPILAFKISDNPDINEPEPQVLYTAIHHAREPAGLSVLIFYAYYLVENYATHPEIQYLINNRELYFIPMINPDGYVYNQTTNPSGGGMWRKNRRNNGSGSYGVDLNRNYGYQWGYDNIGSSPNPNDPTYRGTAPFSEPETQAVRNFCQSKQFKIALNYHTYGNLLIYPWGHLPSYYTPDSAQFVEYAKLKTKANNYLYGTGNQTVGYVVNGDSDDWMYGDQATKNKIFSFTPECGTPSDGFWPAMSRIIPICKENVVQNMYAARLAGEHAESKDVSPKIFSNLSFYLPFTTTSYGVLNANTVSVTLIPLSSYIQSISPMSKTFTSFTSFLHTKRDSFLIQLHPSTPAGSSIKFILQTTFNGITHNDTLTKMFDNTTTTFLLNDNATTLSQWTTSTGWNTTTSKFVSAPSSITDSPTGNYSNNANTRITSLNSISLASATQAKVSFYAQWDIENNYDYVQFMVSPDGGTTWIPQCGLYTNKGVGTSSGGVQPLNEPLYDGVQNAWVKEEIDLSDYLGMSNIKFRFHLRSDNSVRKDGFYFDDFIVQANLLSGITQTLSFTKNDFLIYPNPAQNEINFTLPENTQNIYIIDYTGKIVYSVHDITQGRHIIATSHLPNGLYNVVIYTNNEILSQKVSVNH